jgi:hypothetical protein
MGKRSWHSGQGVPERASMSLRNRSQLQVSNELNELLDSSLCLAD